MRGKEGSTIVTIAISLFLVLALLSPICHSGSEVEEETVGFPPGWTDNIRLTNTSNSNQDVAPRIAVNGENVHIVWEHDFCVVGPGHYDIYYINSNDGGENWNNPIEIMNGTPDKHYRHPDITVNDSNIHIVWDYEELGRILYKNSSDGGISWSQPKNISIEDEWRTRYPMVAVNGSEIHVVWVDERHREESMPWNTELYYVRSLDGGITWDDGLGNIGQERRLTNALYESGGPLYGLCVEDDTIHLVWGDARNGIAKNEIFYKRSLDKGTTWDDGLGNIDVDRVITTNLTASHGLPSIAVNGDTIHLAWIDLVGGGSPWNMYYTKSTDNGASWEPFQLLSDSNDAWKPSIDVEENVVHVVWQDRRDNGVKFEVYYKNSTDNGTTWGNDVRLTDIEGNGTMWPVIDVDNATIHITWFNLEFPIQGDDNREIYYKRYPDFPPDPEYNITLQEGWNLISLPLEQRDESIDQVLQSIDGKWDCIQAYDPLSPEPWKSTNIYRPDQLNYISSLDHRMGFWINITESNVNLTVRGHIPTSTSINLYAGWNLVGYPTMSIDTIANALWGTGADKVEVFDPAEPYRVKEVGATYVMKPGEGYWVHVPADSVWVVDW